MTAQECGQEVGKEGTLVRVLSRRKYTVVNFDVVQMLLSLFVSKTFFNWQKITTTATKNVETYNSQRRY